jgi:hypothetical protein
VVDDVYTTGATLNEIAKTLKRAEFNVEVLTIARVPEVHDRCFAATLQQIAYAGHGLPDCNQPAKHRLPNQGKIEEVEDLVTHKFVGESQRGVVQHTAPVRTIAFQRTAAHQTCGLQRLDFTKKAERARGRHEAEQFSRSSQFEGADRQSEDA